MARSTFRSSSSIWWFALTFAAPGASYGFFMSVSL
jgi:hypothetical protein